MDTTKKISAIFFDLDGTLLDTAHDLLFALNLVLTQNGYDSVSLQELLPHISLGSKTILNNLLKLDVAPQLIEDYKLQFLKAYHDLGHQHTDFFPGMNLILEFLGKKNIPWGVITNKSTALTLPIAKILDFDSLGCKTVVCADTTAHAKPHSAPMLKACDDLDVEPEHCVFIGDAKTDIMAGAGVSMTTVTAAYGYIPPTENISDWHADYTIRSVMELLQLLQTLIN